MEHVERTGVHSGDSISVYPTFSVSNKAKGKILEYTKKLGLGIGIIGLFDAVFGLILMDTFYLLVGLVVGVSFIIMATSNAKKRYDEKLAEYELAQKDFPAYQRKMLAKQKLGK